MSDADAGPGKVVVNRAMSLDGFIAGPDDAMDWIFEYLDNDAFPEVMQATGAMLVGRGTHEVGKRMSGDTDYDGGPVFVLTHRPPDPAEDPTVTFLCDGLDAALETARRAAGDLDVEVFGADVARQCLQAGLLEEILVFIAPVLLGDGVRLFDQPGGANVKLERLETSQAPLATSIWFRVLS
jgi:dihydrofolate reductase